VSLLGRRRVIQDYLAGALWVLPTLAAVVFLLAGAALSNVEVDEGSPLAKLAFQGTADDARRATAQPADVEAIAAEAATALRALGVDPSEVPAEPRP
jgi:uncharacterized membrane protein